MKIIANAISLTFAVSIHKKSSGKTFTGNHNNLRKVFGILAIATTTAVDIL